MKTVTILNPAAGRGDAEATWYELCEQRGNGLDSVPVWRTSRAGEATELARRALREGCSRIVVVGGDGTFNEVLNGCFDEEGKCLNRDCILAPVAAGTGCDLVRTIRSLIKEEETGVALDVGRVVFSSTDSREKIRYFANAASCGQSAEVLGLLRRGLPFLPGKLTYFTAIIRSLARYRPPQMELKVDGKTQFAGKARCIVMANTPEFGGGIVIAPNARPDNGSLEITVVRDASAAHLFRHARAIYRGNHAECEAIESFTGRQVEIRSPENVLIESDGEIVGHLPARIEILPRAIRVALP